MKRILLALITIGGLAAVCLALRKNTPPYVDATTLHKGQLWRSTPPEEVFKKAFWRTPGINDKILHAERREWTTDGATGAAHWQWFISVEPSADLTKWLKEENAFGVHPVKTTDFQAAPTWFPRDLADYDIYAGGARGNLVFLFNKDGKSLYATSSGKGFTPGAAAPPECSSVPIARRLPLTPPPTPSRSKAPPLITTAPIPTTASLTAGKPNSSASTITKPTPAKTPTTMDVFEGTKW